jgi:BirA family biotin operon repressor/biotin-[acetyl-CoA-carboxylase] ligase
LWVSLVLRPALPVARAQALTFLGALSAAAAVRAIHGLDVRLKWPNDLRLGRRKLGGVLVESAGEGALIRYAVVGIGLNVNLDSSGFPPDLRESAVSISAALGRPADRVVLLRRMLTEAGERYALLKAGEAGRLVTEAWSLMDPAVRIVRVCESGRVLEGTVTGLDEDGALLLRLDSGAVERLLAGDVTVLR